MIVAVLGSLVSHLLEEGEHMAQFFLYCALVLGYHLALFCAPRCVWRARERERERNARWPYDAVSLRADRDAPSL